MLQVSPNVALRSLVGFYSVPLAQSLSEQSRFVQQQVRQHLQQAHHAQAASR